MHTRSTHLLAAGVLVLCSASTLAADPPADTDPLPEGAVARVGSPRFRHANVLWAARFSPDGRTVVTGEQNVGVNLWDAATGRLKRRIPLATSRFTDIAFTADGKTLGLFDGKETFRKIDAETGRELFAVELKADGPAQSATIAPDASGFAIGRADQTVRLHDGTGAEVRTLKPRMMPRLVEYSADGKTIAVTGPGLNSNVDLFDAVTGAVVAHLELGEGENYRHAISLAGDTLAVVSGAKAPSVVLWDLKQRRTRQLIHPPGIVHNVTLSADGKRLALGGRFAGTVLIDTASGREVRRFPPGGGIFRHAFSADGKTLLADPPGHGLVLWDVNAAKPLPQSADPQMFVTDLAFLGDGRLVTTADRVRVHDWRIGQLIRSDVAPAWNQILWGVSRDGGLAALTQDDGTVAIVDIFSGEVRRRLNVPGEKLYPSRFSTEGKKLIAERFGGWNIYVFDLATGGVTVLDNSLTGQAMSTGVSPDGKFLAAVHRNPTRFPGDLALCVWDLAERRVVRTIDAWKDNIGGVVVSPDGRWLAATHFPAGPADRDTEIRVWDFATGRVVRRFMQPASRSGVIAFSPDSRTLAAGGDGTVSLLEISSGKERGRVPLGGWAMAAAFSRDGRYLATADWLSPILIWDLHAAKSPATVADKERLWHDLAGEDGKAADLTRRRLLAAPDLAVSLVRERFRPAPPPDADRVRAWIKDLDDARFEVRQKAAAELERLDDRADGLLREALTVATTAEQRRQLQRLLDRGEPASAERVTASRVLELLEQLGTPLARDLLEHFADGPDTSFTREAKASLRRLKRETKP